jgi:hypothetical protein
MNFENFKLIEKTIKLITNKYYYNYNYITNTTTNTIDISFIETKYSSIRPDQYFEMIEEILFNKNIFNYYNTSKLINSQLTLYLLTDYKKL